VSDELLKRVAQAEREAAEALERAAEAGRQLLDVEARAAADRASAALHEDMLAEARAAHARQVGALEAEIVRLHDELERHRQWLNDVQSSTSWKITKLLRLLKGS
jgi:hypothetical protein